MQLKIRKYQNIIMITLLIAIQLCLVVNVRGETTRSTVSINRNCFYAMTVQTGSDVFLTCDVPLKHIVMATNEFERFKTKSSCDINWIFTESYAYYDRSNCLECDGGETGSIATSYGNDENIVVVLFYNCTRIQNSAYVVIDITPPQQDLTWTLFIIAGVIIGIVFLITRKKEILFQRKFIPIIFIFVNIIPTVYLFATGGIGIPSFENLLIFVPTMIISSIWLIIEIFKERKSHGVSSWQTTKPSDDGWGSSSAYTPKKTESKDKKSLFDIISAIAGIIGTIVSIIQML